MVVLFAGAGMTVLATWLVALQQSRQERRFVALSSTWLGADQGNTER